MKTRTKALILVLPTVMLGALAVMACNKHTAPSPVPVSVTLRSFNITLDRSSAPRGTVVFRVRNAGTDDIHEFLVIKTDRAPNALPTEANGSYQEDGPGTQLIDEIEEVNPGDTKELSLDLAEGNYVLICNMVHVEDDGTVEVHYSLGMRTAFRVE
jgi:uncharacterized cupredoxin-like copper-binding protein